MRVEHSSSQQAERYFLDQFRPTKGEKGWMAAFWRIVDGKLVLSKTSFDFKHEDFAEALAMLMCDLMAEASERKLDFDPLPRAPIAPGFMRGANCGCAGKADDGQRHAVLGDAEEEILKSNREVEGEVE
jgi:hypothetical protein